MGREKALGVGWVGGRWGGLVGVGLMGEQGGEGAGAGWRLGKVGWRLWKL